MISQFFKNFTKAFHDETHVFFYLFQSGLSRNGYRIKWNPSQNKKVLVFFKGNLKKMEESGQQNGFIHDVKIKRKWATATDPSTIIRAGAVQQWHRERPKKPHFQKSK